MRLWKDEVTDRVRSAEREGEDLRGKIKAEVPHRNFGLWSYRIEVISRSDGGGRTDREVRKTAAASGLARERRRSHHAF